MGEENMNLVYILLGVILLLVVVVAFLYNRFVTIVNRAKEAWSDIDVQLKRRYDLIPNLVNTVKGYASHESSTFEKVTQARNMAMNAKNLADKTDGENMLSGALKSLFAVSEAYPELKANENFMSLQRELADTEDKVQASRRFYNSNVRDLNTMADAFPSNIIANLFKISKMEFFELSDEKARESVQVSF